MAFCANCGNPLAEGGTFCAACGAPVAQAAPVQPETPVPQQPAAPVQAEPVPPQPTAAPVQEPVPPQPAMPVPPAPVQQPVYQPVYQQPMQPAFNPADHTAEFEADDISKNKVIAMAAYMLGFFGIIIALLAAPESRYASFHSRQALKLEIVGQLVLWVSLILFWTFIVPIVGGIALLVLFVVRIICFFQVCSGKAKDAVLIGSLPFLK